MTTTRTEDMTTVETRPKYTAEYSYPGLLFPETVHRVIEAPTIGAAVAAQPDDGWYAVTIRSAVETKFTAGDQEKWLADDWSKVGQFVIGTMMHADDIPAELDGHDTAILRSNIRSNSKDGYGVKTRRGNWQIASDYDRVLTVEQLAAEKVPS